MPYHDPAGWVKRVESLYRAYDAEGVSALYTDDCSTRMGSRVLSPAEVHAHPKEWFDSLEHYEIRGLFAPPTATSSSVRHSPTTR